MRRLSFGVAVAALGAILLLVDLGSSRPSPAGTPAARPIVRVAKDSSRQLPERRSPPVWARRQARRFVVAYLFYEVGLGGGGAGGTIRAGASQALADDILAQPPIRPDEADPGALHITSLHLDQLPGHPDLALASGGARRPAGPEPFAFLFALRHGRWLAVAPGE